MAEAENAVTFTTLESYNGQEQEQQLDSQQEIQQLVYQTLTILENNSGNHQQQQQEEEEPSEKNGIEEIKDIESVNTDTSSQENKNLHLCSICNYQSSSKLLLQKHVKLHNTDKPYKCPHCDREFRDSIQLTNHVNIHLGFKPHQCENCELTFTTRGELVRHTRYKHTLEKPHKCPQCDYASVELSKLKRHLRTHTGERPYLCPHCDYASRDTFKLKRHIRIHTGEKPYVCPICSSRFSQSNSLKSHLIIHKEGKNFTAQLEGDENGKAGKNKSAVATMLPGALETLKPLNPNDIEDLQKQQQELENQVSEWFQCTECNMKFSTKETLDNHKVKHTGERPYQCLVCSVSFGQQFALRAHLQSHKRAGIDIEKAMGIRPVIDDETIVLNKLQELINNVVENVNPDENITDSSTSINSLDLSLLSSVSSDSDEVKSLLNELVDNVAKTESPKSEQKKSSIASLLGSTASAPPRTANIDFFANKPTTVPTVVPTALKPLVSSQLPTKATLPIIVQQTQQVAQPIIISQAANTIQQSPHYIIRNGVVNAPMSIQVLPMNTNLSNCIIINGKAYSAAASVPIQNSAAVNTLARLPEKVETKVILKNPPKPAVPILIQPAPKKISQMLSNPTALNNVSNETYSMDMPELVRPVKPEKPPKKEPKPKKESKKSKKKKEEKEYMPCNLCGKQFFLKSLLDRHLKTYHNYDIEILGQSCGRLDKNHHEYFLSHLNDTALSQNYSGISISSDPSTSNKTSPTKSANTSNVYNDSVTGITVNCDADNFESQNLESAQDQEMLYSRNESYSSITKDITVHTRTPKKKICTLPAKKKDDPKKSLKTLSHLAPSEKNSEQKKVFETAIAVAKQQTFEIAAALAVGEMAAASPKKEATKPPAKSEVKPAAKGGRKAAASKKTEAAGPDDEKPLKKSVPYKRKKKIKMEDDDRSNTDDDEPLKIEDEGLPPAIVVQERPTRSRREASKRAKVNMLSILGDDEDDDY